MEMGVVRCLAVAPLKFKEFMSILRNRDLKLYCIPLCDFWQVSNWLRKCCKNDHFLTTVDSSLFIMRLSPVFM